MKIREWMNQNSALVTVAAVILLVLALMLLFLGGGGPNLDLPQRQYYFDLKTGELFDVELGLYPPIEAPSGGEGVIAKVYACGNCSSAPEIQWLEKYKAKDKETLERFKIEPPDDPSLMLELEERKLIAAGLPVGTAPGDVKWFKPTQKEARELKLSLHLRCGGKFEICNP